MANNIGTTAKRRTAHLIDIENLCCGVDFTEDEVAEVMTHYSDISERHPEDHLIVASCHRAAPAAWFGCPAARRLVRSGHDGADLALLEVITTEGLANRYDRVIIASGDGLFADAAALLQSQGVEVIVVSRRAQLSRRLELSVREVRFIEPSPQPAEPAALGRAA